MGPVRRGLRGRAARGGVLWPTSRRSLQAFDVNRFYPKTQLSWLARLDHSHCNSADPLTDGLEVCCVFYRPGPGGCYVCCVVVEGFGEQGEGGGCTTGEYSHRRALRKQ